MWISGGNWGVDTYDSVKFSTDGQRWINLTEGLPFELSRHTMVVHDNKLWVIGGYLSGVGNYNQELWYMDIGQ